ncbi:hypothetical protein HYPSUDRAFT_216880 [Hypholoma sublateritium FD-334 SS-4]|uniref:Uncharacterized protein n=1 Tax=Hypholoma sublateritium (strain FD-334 SS-4) TaxID=945553 RepID=A0A0D2PL67_HYPSF|nr:hypothetical protein HYPSUDRAFT_216880 [Hypholoma sublateritium FD-334 SS-4]
MFSSAKNAPTPQSQVKVHHPPRSHSCMQKRTTPPAPLMHTTIDGIDNAPADPLHIPLPSTNSIDDPTGPSPLEHPTPRTHRASRVASFCASPTRAASMAIVRPLPARRPTQAMDPAYTERHVVLREGHAHALISSEVHYPPRSHSCTQTRTKRVPAGTTRIRAICIYPTGAEEHHLTADTHKIRRAGQRIAPIEPRPAVDTPVLDRPSIHASATGATSFPAPPRTERANA